MSILNTYPQLGNIRDSDLVAFSAPQGLTKSGAPRDVFVVPYSVLKSKVATDLKGDSFFAGGELQFGSRFPSSPNNKDIFVFNSSASSLSNYVDTDGISPISVAVSGDVAQWNGSMWVKRGRIAFAGSGGSNTGGGGATVALGAGQVYKFQLPTIAQQTLTAVTANTPVEYNIASFTADAGNPSPAVLSASAVSNVGRITVTQAGYINFSFEEEVQIDSSTAGGSGRDGEFTWMVEQRSSAGTKLRGWTGEHSISDPITSAIKFPISRSIGIVPVSENDYFIVKMAFNSAVANRNLSFQLPSDNPNLEERFEFIYFPTASIEGGGGATGTDYSADEADTAKSLKVAVEETTPAMSGGSPTASPSNITFGTTLGDLYNYAPATIAQKFTKSGASSISNSDLLALYFDVNRQPNIPDNTYEAWFRDAFVKSKTPITIEVDGSAYNLSYNAVRSSLVTGGYNSFQSPVIPTNDRVSATDLTKAINFELVDNEQVTLVSQGFNQWGVTVLGIEFDYQGSSNKWGFEYTGSKTPTHFISNGRAFPVTAPHSRFPTEFETSAITDSQFQVSATSLSWGINIRFSDGTYLNNTRTHLFQTTPGPTPETKAQKVLTKAGAIDWLGIGANKSELKSVSTLPSTTGKSLGDIVNYKGELYELVAGTTDPHIYRGVIGDGPSGSPYLGTLFLNGIVQISV